MLESSNNSDGSPGSKNAGNFSVSSHPVDFRGAGDLVVATVEELAATVVSVLSIRIILMGHMINGIIKYTESPSRGNGQIILVKDSREEF